MGIISKSCDIEQLSNRKTDFVIALANTMYVGECTHIGIEATVQNDIYAVIAG